MRIRLHASPSTTAVPFAYQDDLRGVFHRWAPQSQEIHDGASDYGFGWLHGGRAQRGALHFSRGASWVLGTARPDHMSALLEGIQHDPRIGWGMAVERIELLESPGAGRFRLDSPVLIQADAQENGRRAHLLPHDPGAEDLLRRTLLRKLDAAGISADPESYSIEAVAGAKVHTKLVRIGHAQYRAALSLVEVKGPREVVDFVWSVGLGHLTGCGFGALDVAPIGVAG